MSINKYYYCIILFFLNINASQSSPVLNEQHEQHEQRKPVKTAKPPWYSKIKYTVTARRDYETIILPDPLSMQSAEYSVDSEPLDLSITAGGNLFKHAAISAELMHTTNNYRFQRAGVRGSVGLDEIRGSLLMEYDVGIGSKLGVNVLYNEQTESNDLEVNINGQTSRASFDTDFKMLASDLIAAHSIPMGNFDLRFAYSFSSWDAKVNDARVTGHHHNIMATLYKQWTAALSSELSLQKVYHPDPIILSTDRIRQFDYIAAELRYRFLESSEVSIGIGKISYGERSEARSVSLRYEYEFGVKKTKRRKRSYKIPTPLYRIRMDASILRDTV